MLDKKIATEVKTILAEYLASLDDGHEFVGSWGKFVRLDGGAISRPHYPFMLVDRIEMQLVAHFERRDIPLLIEISGRPYPHPDALFTKERNGCTVQIEMFQKDRIPAQNLIRILVVASHSDYRFINAGYEGSMLED